MRSRTALRRQDRLRDPPVEPEELVVPERGPAKEQARVVRLPADERVRAVVMPEHVARVRHDEATAPALTAMGNRLAILDETPTS